jgi:ParB-like chromosome segregation protein Spo0J
MKILLSDIKIAPRQRRDFGDIGELAESMQLIGQIHNIGVNEDNVLIWGYRRYLAAKQLGWTEIEATRREGLSVVDEQEIELEEDIRRKNRSWQEECLAVAKLFRLKGARARKQGETWSVRDMSRYTGLNKNLVADYVYTISDALATSPKDEELWAAANFSEAMQVLRGRMESLAYAEIERRRKMQAVLPAKFTKDGIIIEEEEKGSVPVSDKTPKLIGMTHVSLRERAQLYNTAFEHLGPPNTPLFYVNKNDREFIHAFWFVGGGNISSLYGSYQVEYLKRVETLFPDAVKVVHLFVGSLPPSPYYVRVGLPQGDYKPDIECDAHQLSSKLPFKADLIYADPPYSVEDSEHYQNAMVNRERVISECAIVLEPGGFLVWLDQALPIFSNNDLQFVGAIAYIRSTANRFRVVSIFRKPMKPCSPPTESSLNTSLPES